MTPTVGCQKPGRQEASAHVIMGRKLCSRDRRGTQQTSTCQQTGYSILNWVYIFSSD